VTGPYLPISPIVPDLSWTDFGVLTNRDQSDYRLGQW